MLGSSALKCLLVSLTAALAAQCAFGGPPTPTSTSFTYQGVLKQDGVPANGAHYLRFQLWNALTGGTQVGADVDHPALAIVDGLFTATLDFGTLPFDGSARWLQVQVITNGGATVTPLTPRQPVSATPYALFALQVDGSTVTNLNAGNLSSGTIPDARFSGMYSNTVILANPANTFAGTFTGSGATVTNLNATNIASGTLSTARLPTGGSWPLTGSLNIDSDTLVIDAVNNRLGVGTTTPTHTVHIASPAPTLAIQDTDSTTDQVGYVSYRDAGNAERAWVGYGTAGSPHFSVVNARSGGNIELSAFGSNGDINLTAGFNGRVNIGAISGALGGVTVAGPFKASNLSEYFNYTGGEVIMNQGMVVGGFTRRLIEFRVNEVKQGDITITGSTVSYNAFTGSHYGWSEQPLERGMLVRMTGSNYRLKGDAGAEVVYGVAPTTTANDPACLGAHLSLMDLEHSIAPGEGHLVAAVGNGDLLVVDSGNGDIRPGDYLISSDVTGHAMLDDPRRFSIGHVVARAAEAVIWDSDGEPFAGRRHRRISVFFENFERGSGADAEIDLLRAEVAGLKAAVLQLTTSSKEGSSQ